MTANEKRTAVREKYRIILGRNKYSQNLRSYVNTKYKDGKYYSDCSSSVAWAYKAAGYPIAGTSLPNTVGLYQSENLADVPVVIKSGVIQNPEVLRVGDLLLFAGTDKSRDYAGYVGHVEMVGEISSGKVTIYGHGSGTPRATEMNAYCKSRYAKKADTARGNRGLIRVRRLIADDGSEPKAPKLGDRELRNGDVGADVRELQQALVGAGYSVGSCGVDGEFGGDTEAAVRAYRRDHGLSETGVCDAAMCKLLTGGDSGSAQPATGLRVAISGCKAAHIRTGPGTSFASVGTCKAGDSFAAVEADGWVPVVFEGQVRWISAKYAKEVE